MHPADELARIRAEIKRLKTREEVLRRAFLRGEAECLSNSAEVRIHEQVSRRFVCNRLPPEILSDDRYWEMRRTRIVRVAAIPNDLPKPKSPDRAPTDDFEVIEPW